MKARAVILAAGFSSRLAACTGGGSKALLPLPGGTFLELAAAALREGGVEDILVVTGHDGEAVKGKALELGLAEVENSDFSSGMFSSVCAGLRVVLDESTEGEKPEGIFILPVDAPLVSPLTVKTLLGEAERKSAPMAAGVLLPVTPEAAAMGKGRELLPLAGHPPLLGVDAARGALAWHGENGLQGYFASLPEDSLEFIVIRDLGIMSDIDTPEDYRARLGRQSSGVSI